MGIRRRCAALALAVIGASITAVASAPASMASRVNHGTDGAPGAQTAPFTMPKAVHRSPKVSKLAAIDTQPHHVVLIWQNSPDFSIRKVVVRRNEGSSAPTSPAAGTHISVGDHVHRVVDHRTKPGQTYSYAVFEKAKGRSISRPATAFVMTQGTTPEHRVPISNLFVQPGQDSIGLAWENPTTPGFIGVMVRRAQGSTPPSGPHSGQAVGELYGDQNAFTDSSLPSSTTYSYAVFAVYAGPYFSHGVTTTTQTSHSFTGPDSVTNLVATHSPSLVSLAWTNPSDADGDVVVVRRTAGSRPAMAPDQGIGVGDIHVPDDTATDPTTTPGHTYTYTAFVRDAAGAYSGSAIAYVVTSNVPRSAQECGHITTDTTWSPSDQPIYELTCEVIVDEKVTLTLEPGTIVKGDNDAGIFNQGTLDATGTDLRPIQLTSINDDTVDGDTNQDGTSSSPNHYDWQGIGASKITGAGPQPVTTLSFVDLSWGVGIDVAGEVAEVTHCAITNTDQGLEAVADGTNTSSIDLESNLIDHSANDGIRVTTSGNYQPGGRYTYVGAGPTVSSNTVTNSADSGLPFAAIRITGQVNPNLLSGNTATNDGINGIVVDGLVDTDVTFPITGAQFVVEQLTVDPGAAMTLGPDTVLKFDDHSPGDPTGLYVAGSLIASGTAAKPVHLTAITDDSVGGDTNNDGGNSVPIAGSWGSIAAGGPVHVGDGPPIVNLDHIDLTYGRGITDDASTFTLTNSHISKVSGTAVSAFAGAAPYTVDISSNFIDHAWAGIYAADGGGPGAVIADNSLSDLNDPASEGGQGAAIAVGGKDIIGDRIHGNYFSNDPVEAIEINGTLGADFTVSAGTTYTYGLIVIPYGTTMTLEPGAVLKGEDGYLTIHGALVSNGTALAPVALTSASDDSVGSTTAQGASPVRGDAGRMVMYYDDPDQDPSTTPSVDLDNTSLRYFNGLDFRGQTAARIVNSQVLHSAGRFGINDSMQGAASVDLENNVIDGVTEPIEDNDPGASHDCTGIDVYEYNTDGPAPIVSNNTVSNVNGEAISVFSPLLVGAKLFGNSGTGDYFGAINVSGTLVGDLTLPTSGLPWTVGQYFTVAPGVTFTLNPGTVLKALAADYPYPYNPWLNVLGTLRANGTAANPVVITSTNDNSIGKVLGDPSAAGKPGDWGYIVADTEPGQPSATIDLEHTEVRYSTGVRSTGASDLTLRNDLIGGGGAWSQISADIAKGGAADVEHTQASGVDIYVQPADTSDTSVVTNNAIEGGLLSMTSPDLDPARLAGNTQGNNPTIVGMEVNGTLAVDATVPVSGTPWIVDTGLTVSPGHTLTVPAGGVLKFAPDHGTLHVQGTLISNGTVDSPTAVTGLADTSVGGAQDTAHEYPPSIIEWVGITAQPVDGQPLPVVQLRHTRIANASTALTDPLGDESISGTVVHDQRGIVGPPVAVDGSCPDGTVDATGVDWGTPTGPAPVGTGPSVSGCVTHSP